MPYSGSLSNKEWEIIAPLMPQKKPTRPPKWSQRQILDGVLYQLKNGCNWCDFPKDLPPYSTVFWHYKQWRKDKVIEQMMTTLHGQVREQAEKTAVDNLAHHRLTSGEEYMQCECHIERILSLQMH